MFDIYVKSYDEILMMVSEEELALKYLGMRVGKFHKSLFRKDPNPSATIYRNNKGRLQYNDFVYHYSLPYAIMIYKGWNNQDFLRQVSVDFNLSSVKNHQENSYNAIIQKLSIPIFKKHTVIKRKLRAFEDHDISFWGKYGIQKEWLQHPSVKVNPISHFWVENEKGTRMFKADKYAYCYDYFQYDDRILRKIYQPYNKIKWVSNVVGGVGGVCQLWETLPKEGRDLLIVTSSLKDGGTIYCNTYNILSRNEGIYTIAPNNESGYLPEQIIPKINKRFKNVLVWFDNDEAGIKAAKKYQSYYGWKYVYNPIGYPKDPSDFREKYGQKEFLTLFKYLIYNDS